MIVYQPDIAREASVPDYPYTNDFGLGNVYDEISRFNDSVPLRPTDCAVLVGSGGLLSMADVLPETVYITDRDERLLEWTAKHVGAVLASEDRSGFLRAVRATGYSARAEDEVFGARHFLSSAERYTVARQALAKQTVHFVQVDYGRQYEAEGLARVLTAQDKQVRFFNATNLHRHIATESRNDRKLFTPSEYVSSLHDLPWASDFQIASSAINLLGVRSLPVQTSLEGYERTFEEGHAAAVPPKRKKWFPLWNRRYLKTHLTVGT